MTTPLRKNHALQELAPLSIDFPGSGFTAAVAASGTILCAADAAAGDGDTVTVGDGIRPPVVFEYDKAGNGVAGSNTAWAVGTTAASNATALRLLILAAFPSLSVVDDLAGLLTITHRWPGTGGNITITETGTVCTTVTGMSGGAAAAHATTITVDTTIKFFKALAAFEVEKVEFISPTGLTQDATNFVVLTVKNGATVVATWSTETGQEGTLTANTFKTATLSVVADACRLAADDVLSLSLDCVAGGVLPAGRCVVHGHYRSATQ